MDIGIGCEAFFYLGDPRPLTMGEAEKSNIWAVFEPRKVLGAFELDLQERVWALLDPETEAHSKKLSINGMMSFNLTGGKKKP